ncbi:MAG: metallophosphoesterase [Thermoanaerobaculaceae bacterium]|nr:metallophosphoesterase [Thermoanaerobaculaceae bacterium]
MSGAGRVTVFFTIVLGVWTAMHLYVFWRAASVPVISSHLSRGTLAAIAAFLWVCYPLSRVLEHRGLDLAGRPLEFVGSTWMGVLTLAFFALLALDLVTLGGFLLPRLAPMARGWALVAAAALAAVALVQGLRPPVVVDYDVTLPRLPSDRDGTVLVELSDVHLGTLIGGAWMARLVDRVEAMKPDLIVVDGDLIDGNVARVEPMVPVLRRLAAPLGVWAVTGNHEFYAGLARSVKLFEDAGFHVLQDRSAEVVPGLVFAGVDDLTARRQLGVDGEPVERALADRPPGAAILLSHTPWQAAEAASLGAGLMLSGHTHDGQIWPFGYLVRLTYPLLGGRYQVGGMTAIVCRGTGTWGPRMRLWRPSEIVRITLRSGKQ